MSWTTCYFDWQWNCSSLHPVSASLACLRKAETVSVPFCSPSKLSEAAATQPRERNIGFLPTREPSNLMASDHGLMTGSERCELWKARISEDFSCPYWVLPFKIISTIADTALSFRQTPDTVWCLWLYSMSARRPGLLSLMLSFSALLYISVLINLELTGGNVGSLRMSRV